MNSPMTIGTVNRRTALVSLARCGMVAAVAGVGMALGGCKAVEGVHRAKTNFRRRIFGQPPVEAEPENPYER